MADLRRLFQVISGGERTFLRERMGNIDAYTRTRLGRTDRWTIHLGVTDWGSETTYWTLTVRDGAVSAVAGLVGTPTVSIVGTGSALKRVATGEIPPHDLEATGELLVEGDHSVAVELANYFPSVALAT